MAAAFARDRDLLEDAGYTLKLVLSQPGFIRAIIGRDEPGGQATRIDWAHDSAWRFLPLVRDELGGYLLHEIDLAVNKTLTLAGRDEARDLVDILYVHRRVLPPGALISPHPRPHGVVQTLLSTISRGSPPPSRPRCSWPTSATERVDPPRQR